MALVRRAGCRRANPHRLRFLGRCAVPQRNSFPSNRSACAFGAPRMRRSGVFTAFTTNPDRCLPGELRSELQTRLVGALLWPCSNGRAARQALCQHCIAGRHVRTAAREARRCRTYSLSQRISLTTLLPQLGGWQQAAVDSCLRFGAGSPRRQDGIFSGSTSWCWMPTGTHRILAFL